MAPRRRVVRAVAFLAGISSAGCFAPDNGRSPPLDRLYFPVGLVTDPDASRLYVVNSDFDLQFNAGTLQAYDLAKVRALAPQGCSVDADCAVDRDGAPRDPGAFFCDSVPTDKNGLVPSYFCVARADPRPCGALGEKTAAERLVAPGPCAHRGGPGPLGGPRADRPFSPAAPP